MLRAPDFTHAALAQALHETVASELSRFGHRLAQRVDDTRTHIGHDRRQQIRKDDPEEELDGIRTERRPCVATMKPMTTGTELTDASVASSALSGRVGITTVKSSVHTATQESPIQPFMSRRCGSRILGERDAVAADDFESRARRFITIGSGTRVLKVNAHTSSATVMETTPGTQFAGSCEHVCAVVRKQERWEGIPP